MGLVITMTVYFAVQINNPSELTVWLFYWFGDLYISLMLAAFLRFLHDTVDLKNAKRLYGFIVLGAVSGGRIGSTYFRGWIKEMTNQQWLHFDHRHRDCHLHTGCARRMDGQDHFHNEPDHRMRSPKKIGRRHRGSVAGIQVPVPHRHRRYCWILRDHLRGA